MNPLRTAAATVAAFALTATLALPARAQPVKPAADRDSGAHRLEIWNGPFRTVHYFSFGTSPGEQTALRDLERAENDLAVADQVQGLRRLYLRNERVLEERRGQVNPLLYGYSSVTSGGLYPGVVAPGYAYGGYPGAFGSYGVSSLGYPYSGSSSGIGTAANSLAFGVGYEGVLKTDLARGLAGATAPEVTARAVRAYDAAVARVAESDRLRADLGWGKGGVAAVGRERTIGGPVTLTMKDGKTIDGTLVNEEPDWITVETRTEEVSVRKADVTRIVRPKKETKP